MTREELEAQIKVAARGLVDAQAALADWEARPENNVFATLEEAENVISDALRGQASDDCEGSYNCGDPEYAQRSPSKSPPSPLPQPKAERREG